MTTTTGILLVDGIRAAYTLEPPAKSRGLKAIEEGCYSVSLSHHSEMGRLMLYVIGVPQYGAVVIGWKPPRRGSTECYIRLTETEDRSHDNPAEDERFFNEFMLRITQAKPESIVLEVVSENNIDLEGDTQNASRYQKW